MSVIKYLNWADIVLISLIGLSYLDEKMIDLTHLPAALAPDFWPAPIWPVSFLLLLWFIRFLNIFSYPEAPVVIVADKQIASGSQTKDILDKCTILKEKYDPPLIWGRNGHIQTAIYGVLGHSSLKRCFDKRHYVKLEDGTTVTFDVFEPIAKHESGGDFTLALCPGIANSSESNYIRTLVHYAQENGYRCAVLNHLGALKDVALTSNHIFSYGGTDEIESMMDKLFDLYPATKFMNIGFSMGGNVTTRYISKVDDSKRPRILIGLSVCQGYCAVSSAPVYHDWENGRRIYNYIITENMKRLLQRNAERAVAPHVQSGLVDEQKLWGATSIVVFDETYSRRVWGFKSVSEYYRWVSCLHLIPKIQTPIIFLNAEDDPIIPEKLYTPVKELCATHPRHAFIKTKHGGHLGFLEGKSIRPNSVTWLDRLILEIAGATIQVMSE